MRIDELMGGGGGVIIKRRPSQDKALGLSISLLCGNPYTVMNFLILYIFFSLFHVLLARMAGGKPKTLQERKELYRKRILR